MDLHVSRIGGSLPFASWHSLATQDDRVVLTALASVGDRRGIDGPSWTDLDPWQPADDQLSPRAGDRRLPFTAPQVAERFSQRIAMSTSGFALGRNGGRAWMRATVDVPGVDQLAAIVACDLTPPAVWNVLGTASSRRTRWCATRPGDSSSSHASSHGGPATESRRPPERGWRHAAEAHGTRPEVEIIDVVA